jgi:hypothetical protein
MSIPTTILTPTRTNLFKEQVTEFGLRWLPQRVICACLGLLGGAIGVVLTIGLAVLIQSLLSPRLIYSPDATQFTVIAAFIGAWVSWVLGRVAHRVSPSLSHSLYEQGMQVILVFSVFISLLMTFLFFAPDF